MRSLVDQTHYELLELDRDASGEEVERAYRMAQSTYAPESLATYSLMGEDEAAALRERLELAYEVLSDPASRQRYDEVLDGHEDGVAVEERSLLLPSLEQEPPAPEPVRLRAPAALPIEGFTDEEQPDAPYDGARLRRARLARGVEVDQVAEITKVNPSYLHFIEEERFDDLPASVYVRGFVTAYARCLGLDAGLAASSYLERLQQHRSESEEARGWGRG